MASSTAIILHPSVTDEVDLLGTSGYSTTGASGGSSSSYRGLSNQGATCYMNSLLQTLYMTPEFRTALYKWEYDPEKVSHLFFCLRPFYIPSKPPSASWPFFFLPLLPFFFLKDGEEKDCIPLQLQRLFGSLQLSSRSAIETKKLTLSFGWEGTEVFQQNDVQVWVEAVHLSLFFSFFSCFIFGFIRP